MGEFLGEVKPVYGRWVWPLKEMGDGDWFIVSWELRDPEHLRNLISVRAAQLGRRFMVEKRPVEYPGFTKVTCNGVPQLAERDQVNFETITGLIQRLYDVDQRNLKWTGLDIGEMEERIVEREGEPEQSVHCVIIPDDWKFIVELLPDRFRIERVEIRDTLERWQKRRMAELLD